MGETDHPPDRAERFAEVRTNAAALRRRLDQAGGAAVEVVAVTKGFGPVEVAAARAAGLSMIGENYAQELVAKRAALDEDVGDAASVGAGDPVRWHFIGRLQRNKVKLLTGLVDVWQSVDRIELVREIAKRDPAATVYVQVDVSGEPAKGGCDPADLRSLVEAGRELGLRVDGVMAVGPTGPPDRAAEPFRRLVAQADELGLAQRSLGMSGDLEVAVAAGSTMVRIGRDLFGARPRPPAGAAPSRP